MMKNARIGLASFLVFGLIVCATSANSDSDEVRKIQFLNSKSFDKRLSAAMRADEPAIKVTFPIPFTTNEIPDRIDRWLVAIEDHGWTVDVAPEQIERGLFNELVTLFFKGVFKEFKEKILYGPAKDYDATVYYEVRTGEITRIIFSRKTS